MTEMQHRYNPIFPIPSCTFPILFSFHPLTSSPPIFNLEGDHCLSDAAWGGAGGGAKVIYELFFPPGKLFHPLSWLITQNSLQLLPCSPVFIPHPVFVPERGEKDRIRQEVEERIVLEEKRLEEEERRRKEEIIRREENAQRLIQEEERRRQEVEYWRRKVQEEEERRRQEEELRLKIKEEEEMEARKIKEEEERLRREKEVREEFLVPAASSREARIAVGNLLDTDHLDGRKESVELPPRVRMECFRFTID